MTPETQAMMTKAGRSLEVANGLREQGHFDFAASRAYYAMLYAVEALLSSIGQSYSSHGQTLGAYGKEFSKTGKFDAKYHRWILDAEDYRLAGDYEMGESISPDEAEEVCTWAKEFIEAVNNYLSKKAS